MPSDASGKSYEASPRGHDVLDHDEAGRDDSHGGPEGMIIVVQARTIKDGTQRAVRDAGACMHGLFDGGAHADGNFTDLAFLEGTWERGAGSRLQGLKSALTAPGNMLATWSRPYRKLHTSRRRAHERLHDEASDDEDHRGDYHGPIAPNAGGEDSGHRADGAGAKQEGGVCDAAQLMSTTMTVKGICCPAGGCIQG